MHQHADGIFDLMQQAADDNDIDRMAFNKVLETLLEEPDPFARRMHLDCCLSLLKIHPAGFENYAGAKIGQRLYERLASAAGLQKISQLPLCQKIEDDLP